MYKQIVIILLLLNLILIVPLGYRCMSLKDYDLHLKKDAYTIYMYENSNRAIIATDLDGFYQED